MTWSLWVAVTGATSYALATSLLSEDKTFYLPDETTNAHYQIELSCDTCHGDAFDGPETIQKACVKCHGDELRAVNDSHPKKKFLDPRNADRLAMLDARYCVTCHVEHKPKMTNAMAVTQPGDFCSLCHQNIAKDRPSHKGMAFNTCSSAGCHNYHDNKALYEDFLVKHMDEPEIHAQAVNPTRNLSEFTQKTKPDLVPLSVNDIDFNRDYAPDDIAVTAWKGSAHANGGVNCMDCHKEPDLDDPKKLATVCQSCHKNESAGFFAGKHGMKLNALSVAMRPSESRTSIKQKQQHTKLTCSTCHDSHRYDTQSAAVDACMKCHNDKHTTQFKQSPHFRLWQKETQGIAESGSGVSCASCHMPRELIKDKGHERVLVQHNQNANLKPREKMIRGVCMNCHGLGFSIDALSDPKLIANNFSGRPSRHIESIDMAKKRELEKRLSKANPSGD